MEGIIFFWFSWIGWVYITFSLRKDHPYRIKLAFALLIIIICSSRFMSIRGFHVNITFILLICFVYAGMIKLQKRQLLFLMISSFIVSLIYVSFQLVALFDPIWILFKKEWMLSFILSYVTILLYKKPGIRVYTLLSGMIQGEILYSVILYKKYFEHEIGSLAFLDICAISLMFIVSWRIFEMIVYSLESYFESNRKEKQRIS